MGSVFMACGVCGRCWQPSNSCEPCPFCKVERLVARLTGRAATIRRLVREREAARKWLRGEIPGLDPNPWACAWCGEMIRGGRKDAKLHVLSCRENPLVVERTAICQKLVGQDDCLDVPGVIEKVLHERDEAQWAIAALRACVSR